MPEGTEVEQASTTQVESNTVASSSGKKQVNWVLVLILSIFLGQLGIDRFMMGQVGLGILKLITFGGFGIWWLIDVIMIATKHEFKGIEWV
ncbi:MAG: TM2 domain-containing protein [bacterium]